MQRRTFVRTLVAGAVTAAADDGRVRRCYVTKSVREAYDCTISDGIAPIRRRGELGFSTGEAVHVDGGLHIQTL